MGCRGQLATLTFGSVAARRTPDRSGTPCVRSERRFPGSLIHSNSNCNRHHRPRVGGVMFGDYKRQEPSFCDFVSAARPYRPSGGNEITKRPTGSPFVVAKHRPTGINRGGGVYSYSDFTQPGVVFQIGVAPRRIDILTSISGVEFQDAWNERHTAIVDGLQLHFLSRKHLIENKRASGSRRIWPIWHGWNRAIHEIR